MSHGGPRVGAGRPKGRKTGQPLPEREVDMPAEWETPVEYMLRVLNDPSTDASRRDRLAVALAPYLHGKPSETGKKESKDNAAHKVSQGRFNSPVQPKLDPRRLN